MANPEHLALLKQGVETWNQWRKKNPSVAPDLRNADLRFANLRCVDFHDADLRDGLLSDSDLRDALLNNTLLRFADLSGTNLHSANLCRAQLQVSRLVGARFDNAILTDACLWETQRAGWSIQGVSCEAIYWDEHHQERIIYAPGEFERLFSEQIRIVLHYAGGVSAMELASLPALIQKLHDDFPGCSFRLQSIQDAGGGATVAIVVENASDSQVGQIETDAQSIKTLFRRELMPLLESTMTSFQSEVVCLLEERTEKLLAISTETNRQLAELHQLVIDTVQALTEQRPAELTDEQWNALNQSLTTIRQQLEAQAPDYSFLGQAAISLRNIMDGASGGIVTAGLLKLPEILRTLEILAR